MNVFLRVTRAMRLAPQRSQDGFYEDTNRRYQLAFLDHAEQLHGAINVSARGRDKCGRSQ
jgi:hypothetical protein